MKSFLGIAMLVACMATFTGCEAPTSTPVASTGGTAGDTTLVTWSGTADEMSEVIGEGGPVVMYFTATW